MSAETHIGSSAGPTHSGTGNQYNVFNAMGDAAREPTQRDPRRVAEDSMARLKKCFVHPPGSAEARQLLQQSNMVLLSAAQGNGAKSAARILLWEYPHGQERFGELDEESLEDGNGRTLTPKLVEDEACLLLDLTRTNEDRYRTLMRELPGFRVTVRDRNARLAVVVDPDRTALLHEELTELVARLERPKESDVLQQHLLVNGIKVTERDLADEQLSAFFSHTSMGDIEKLALHIHRARNSARPGTGFQLWLHAALSAMRPGKSDVADLLAKRTTGPERALLAATAFLEGASSETIYAAADQLLTITQHPKAHAPVLQHLPLKERLDLINATADGELGQVRFTKPLFAEAARTYFWDNFPQLRPRLNAWVSGAAGFSGADHKCLRNLVTRYADECLRTGPPEALSKLAEQWTEKSAAQAELAMAARALGEGVTHPRFGSHFRRRIYDLSRDGNLSRGRANVLIGVCSEALAVGFPEQALVRLHHLSHRNDPDIRASAREALVRVTDSDDHLYGHLLTRLLDRIRIDPEGEGHYDRVTFLQVAEPRRIPGQATARALLAELWAAVLTGLEPTQWTPAFRTWLDSARSGAGTESPVLAVIAEACARDGRALGLVRNAAEVWASADDSRRRIADALWERAIAALGVHPSTFTY
ncbi:hypothetical protein HCC61_13500 [Streptomyces sp. HNM0575]|uniref:hypothetical protein n=1 Tax=Streptomyces sp. HNM0575 TaxID=2716338 RepID=UPI00145C7650|nr:hypothetical protein [Streptomyces sp. HNM0575]NLU73682.1 hypothetical protein [Streptomyces sp. HNM0575]